MTYWIVEKKSTFIYCSMLEPTVFLSGSTPTMEGGCILRNIVAVNPFQSISNPDNSVQFHCYKRKFVGATVLWRNNALHVTVSMCLPAASSDTSVHIG